MYIYIRLNFPDLLLQSSLINGEHNTNNPAGGSQPKRRAAYREHMHVSKSVRRLKNTAKRDQPLFCQAALKAKKEINSVILQNLFCASVKLGENAVTLISRLLVLTLNSSGS